MTVPEEEDSDSYELLAPDPPLEDSDESSLNLRQLSVQSFLVEPTNILSLVIENANEFGQEAGEVRDSELVSIGGLQWKIRAECTKIDDNSFKQNCLGVFLHCVDLEDGKSCHVSAKFRISSPSLDYYFERDFSKTFNESSNWGFAMCMPFDMLLEWLDKPPDDTFKLEIELGEVGPVRNR